MGIIEIIASGIVVLVAAALSVFYWQCSWLWKSSRESQTAAHRRERSGDRCSNIWASLPGLVMVSLSIKLTA